MDKYKIVGKIAKQYKVNKFVLERHSIMAL